MKEEVLKELIAAACVAIDLLGIDVEKAFPNLYREFLENRQKDIAEQLGVKIIKYKPTENEGENK